MILLTIGYQKFVIKEDKAAFAVMSTLSKAIDVEDRRYGGVAEQDHIQIKARQPKIEMEVLPPGTKFQNESGAEIRESKMEKIHTLADAQPPKKVLRLMP